MSNTHGLRATYVHGCRCEECREAHSAYERERRAARRARGAPEHVTHGKPSTYSNWSCRCAERSAAWKVEMRRQSDKRKARATS